MGAMQHSQPSDIFLNAASAAAEHRMMPNTGLMHQDSQQQRFDQIDDMFAPVRNMSPDHINKMGDMNIYEPLEEILNPYDHH